MHGDSDGDTRPVLSVRSANKHYGGVHALRDVDFHMQPGEIHCLVGENGSGKSTLVKIVTGVVQPDKGTEVILSDEEFTHLTPFAALKRGIHVVHQDLSLFPNLTVAENITSHEYAESGLRLVNWKASRAKARRVLDELDLELDPGQIVGELSVADQQLVAICRAIAGEAIILIMDEPTAALTYNETERLFGFLKRLTDRNVSVLFISHRLDEILDIGQRITVLRNGDKVGSYPADELNRDELIQLMTGKQVTRGEPTDFTKPGPPILRTEELTRNGQYEDVDVELRSGEILGLIGPRGAGRTEIALTLFGLNPPDSGRILVDERPVRIVNNRDAMRLGIAYVPENRLREGLVLSQSIENNAVITNLSKILGPMGLTDSEKKTELTKRIIRDFEVVTSGVQSLAKTLSGGNQQKLVLGKWVRTSPKVLILDSPTNGVDVGAKDGIRSIIAQLAEQGIAILLISDEESEILENCPRTLIMRAGKMSGPYDTAKLDETTLRAAIRNEQEISI